jgi:hypothetical protein
MLSVFITPCTNPRCQCTIISRVLVATCCRNEYSFSLSSSFYFTEMMLTVKSVVILNVFRSLRGKKFRKFPKGSWTKGWCYSHYTPQPFHNPGWPSYITSHATLGSRSINDGGRGGETPGWRWLHCIDAPNGRTQYSFVHPLHRNRALADYLSWRCMFCCFFDFC